MKLVQQAVQHGCEHDGGCDQEYQAGVKCIQPGESLTAVCLRRIYRPHAAEQHGDIKVGAGQWSVLARFVHGY